MAEPTDPRARPPRSVFGPVILGSGSPRRRELLASVDLSFEVLVAGVDEADLVDADVVASVERTSAAKFAAFSSAYPEMIGSRLVLTADTLVAGADQVLGKPASDHAAEATLHMLSGQELTIASAICFGVIGADPASRTVTTTVQLRTLDPDEIRDYVATGAAHDKAGALELQGRAATFMERVDGCWSNVVGLPLCATVELLDARKRALGPLHPDELGLDLDLEAWSPCSGRSCGADRG